MSVIIFYRLVHGEGLGETWHKFLETSTTHSVPRVGEKVADVHNDLWIVDDIIHFVNDQRVEVFCRKAD